MLLTATSARARLLCATALVIQSTMAMAQDETNEADVISLDPIDVRAQDPNGAAADRATAVYVSDAELERSRLGNLRDLFSGLASVQVGGALPVAQKIFVNGIDMLNLTVSLDGILQNNRTFHHVSANALDPGLLKFVRVDPGIAAADTGPNALAGAVVMETIDAADFLEEGDNFGGTARLSFADNGNTFGRALTLAGRSNGFEVLAYGRLSTGDNYVDGSGKEILGTGADFKSGLLKFAYESDQGHRIELSAQQLVDDAVRPYRANIGQIIGGKPTPVTRIYDTTRQNFSLSYENTNVGGLWNPKVVIGYSSSEINVPEPFGSESKTGTWSGKVANTFYLNEENTVDAGVDFYDRKADYSDPTTPVLNESSKNVGVFVQGRFDLADVWQISTGLRYDWQDFDGVGTFTDSVSGASGNISVTYNFTENFSLRAGYSSVFGGLQLEDSYIFSPRWNYSGLRPSRSENYSIGADWINTNFTLGGEFFLTKIQDARNGDQNFDFESKGFNLGATYGWGNGFLRLTYSDSDVKVNGRTADSYSALDFGAPIGQVLALEVQQSLPQWNMLVGGSINAAADYDVQGRYSNREIEGYQVVNVFAEYTPPTLSGLTLRASIVNLFDEDYADRATYGADFQSVVTLSEPGRTFVVEAIVRF